MNQDQQRENQVQEILSYYQKQPREQENYCAMLEELQEVYGFLSQEILERAAQVLELKPAVLTCLIKFSSSLKFAPYQHKIVACTGERCKNKNGLALFNILKKELQTDKNGLSQDQKILVTTQNCLKHCKTSPNIMIDGTIHPHMTEEKLKDLLKRLT